MRTLLTIVKQVKSNTFILNRKKLSDKTKNIIKVRKKDSSDQARKCEDKEQFFKGTKNNIKISSE
jgi:hypothetical protein